MKSIAYFVTPHGFGHATRACAVMAALMKRWPELRPEIFTQVPQWLFSQSLTGDFGYHALTTDVGLAQKDALTVDLAATRTLLDQLLPFDPVWVEALAGQVTELGCELLFCDIAPLGIAVARAAGIPSVVVENFTWDWIYAGYVEQAEWLQSYIDYLAAQFAAADYHIQTQPIPSVQKENGCVDRVVAPVSRPPRTPAAQIREQLEVPSNASLVLVTMGGMDWQHTGLARLGQDPSVHYLFTGSQTQFDLPANVHMLGQNSAFYHPDLVAASDAVVGKIGYSTLAEVYHAGIPFGYIPRPHFRESAVLAEFVATQMQGFAIAEAEFSDGDWLSALPRLLSLPRRSTPVPNGADEIATFFTKTSLFSNHAIDSEGNAP